MKYDKIFVINLVREALFHNSDYIPSDFEGWCESASHLVYYIATKYMERMDSKIHLGTFDNDGHFWCEVDGEIIDCTIEQFGETYSCYEANRYKSQYHSTCEKPFEKELIIEEIAYVDTILKK